MHASDDDTDPVESLDDQPSDAELIAIRNRAALADTDRGSFCCPPAASASEGDPLS